MASENTTTVVTNGSTGDAAHNATMDSLSSPVSLTGLIVHWDFVFLTGQITLSALGIIWLGANSSLRRPPSAAPAKTKSGKRENKSEDKFADGFVPSDAIMLPIFAGCILISLYYIIQWLQDPDILNKILRAYLSTMAVASLGKFCADALHVLTSLIFPTVWTDRMGRLYKIDSRRRRQMLLVGGIPSTPVVATGQKKSPLPGSLSTKSFSDKTNNLLWEIRHLLKEEWTVRVSLHGLGSSHIHIKLNDILGVLLALSMAMTYYMTGWFWLSNMLGVAFSYTTFSLMSPTSFAIGTMVLGGLFIYDIVMVFYTPYMVTVATKLDVPIKLVFQGPSRSSMLGLGDIVIPGIFIALALRFDLWRYYQKQIKYFPVVIGSELRSDVESETTVIASKTQYRCVKVPFIDPRGQWGDSLWTASPRHIFSPPTATPHLAAAEFPRTYFYAAMVGYTVGMLLTSVVMLVFNHGQPALLYLVPCVTGAVWLTGAVRKELHLLWIYTEDGSLDTADVVVELDGEGQVIKEVSSKEAADETVDGKKNKASSRNYSPGAFPRSRSSTITASEGGGVGQAETTSDQGVGCDVFTFSITTPGQSNSKDE